MSIFPGVDPCDDKVQGVFFRLSFLGLFQLGGGFKYFLFSSLFGEDFHFDLYFSKSLKPPTSSIFHQKIDLQKSNKGWMENHRF